MTEEESFDTVVGRKLWQDMVVYQTQWWTEELPGPETYSYYLGQLHRLQRSMTKQLGRLDKKGQEHFGTLAPSAQDHLTALGWDNWEDRFSDALTMASIYLVWEDNQVLAVRAGTLSPDQFAPMDAHRDEIREKLRLLLNEPPAAQHGKHQL